MNNKNFTSQKNNNPYRINEEINSPKVRLIDQEGNMVGIEDIESAISRARNVGLDLVEVSPHSQPPVCKIANFGKMKYELQKKAADAKKKQKIVETKEIKMTINIGKGDYDFKLRHAKEFIEKGHKVKIMIRMKGREISHREIAEQMMENILLETKEFSKPEYDPRLEGMQHTVTLVANK